MYKINFKENRTKLIVIGISLFLIIIFVSLIISTPNEEIKWQTTTNMEEINLCKIISDNNGYPYSMLAEFITEKTGDVPEKFAYSVKITNQHAEIFCCTIYYLKDNIWYTKTVDSFEIFEFKPPLKFVLWFEAAKSSKNSFHG